MLRLCVRARVCVRPCVCMCMCVRRALALLDLVRCMWLCYPFHVFMCLFQTHSRLDVFAWQQILAAAFAMLAEVISSLVLTPWWVASAMSNVNLILVSERCAPLTTMLHASLIQSKPSSAVRFVTVPMSATLWRPPVAKIVGRVTNRALNAVVVVYPARTRFCATSALPMRWIPMLARRSCEVLPRILLGSLVLLQTVLTSFRAMTFARYVRPVASPAVLRAANVDPYQRTMVNVINVLVFV